MEAMNRPPANPKHQHEGELLVALLELPLAERAAFLERECGANAALRQRLEKLLLAHDESGAFLEKAAVCAAPVSPSRAVFDGVESKTLLAVITEKPGDCIGRYKLLQQIGEGGCGVVYMAEQEEPVRRRVALKVIKLGMDTKQVIARFEAERQALALMDHPNIAKVLDAAATETGRPYFVMELVRGIKITDYCDQNNLSTRVRLDLFIQVCHAIQHAHQKGIIHRDIKPSNILVSLQDGVPVPVVINFGIAKATEQRLTDKTLFTAFEQFIGTPAYMSPEQAELSRLDIDTRSDIYALGVLLYELLTGKTPFDAKTLVAAGLEEMRRIIREEEPVRPSTRITQERLASSAIARNKSTIRNPQSAIDPDLDWIVMKCLEKDRTRRYETANGLAQDIERHLNHEPVAARPPSTAYRIQKSVRRNRVMVTAGMAVAAALVLGVVVSTWLAVRASRQRARAEANELLARQHAYAADMNLAFRSFDENNLGGALDLLEQHGPKPSQSDLRGWEWRYLWEQCQSDGLFVLGEHSDGVTTVCFVPDGKTLASGSYDRTVRIWDLETRQPRATLPHNGALWGLAFSPDGKWLATWISPKDDPVRIWDTRSWNLATTWTELKFVGSLAFSPDGKMLATAGENGGTLWEISTHRQAATFPAMCGTINTGGQGVAFSPTGHLLAYLRRQGDQPAIGLYDIRAGKELGAMTGPEFTMLAFSPDDRFIASGGWDRTVRLWDVAAREQIRILSNHTARVSSVAFSPDGSTLATAGADQRIRLWNTVNWQEAAVLKGHRSEIFTLAYSPDGKRLASGDRAGTIRLWSAIPPAGELAVVRRSWDFLQLYLGPVGPAGPEEYALLYEDGRLVFWSTLGLREYGAVPGLFAPSNTVGETISASGRLVAQGLSDHTVRVWDTISREEEVRLGPFPETVYPLRFSRNGEYLITMGESLLHVWRFATAQPVACWTNDLGPLSSPALFSPDARYMCTGHEDGRASLWALDGSGRRTLLEGHRAGIAAIDISTAAGLVATTSDDATVRLWDLKTGKPRVMLRGQLLHSVVFSPDGSRMAAGTGEGQIDIWDTTLFRKLATLRGTYGSVLGLAFSPDGNTLSSFTVSPGWKEYEVRLWRGASPDALKQGQIKSP